MLLACPDKRGRLHQPENDIHLRKRVLRHIHHILSKLILRLMNARRIQKHNLSALHIRIHGLDAVSVRRDSNLLTDQMIHQRRFSHIRSSYNRHKSGFKIIFHRSPRFCTVFPAPHQVRLSSVSNICFSDVSTSSLPITHRLPSESTDAIKGFNARMSAGCAPIIWLRSFESVS